MSDHLPENVSDWPSDPFALLGVSYDTDPREARRAYFELVRRFKPEHAPTEFQRIREAYDAVRPMLERRAQGESRRGRDDLWEAEDQPAEIAETATSAVETEPIPESPPRGPAEWLQAAYARHAQPQEDWAEGHLLAAAEAGPRYHSKLDKRDFKNVFNQGGKRTKQIEPRTRRPAAEVRPHWDQAAAGEVETAYAALRREWERRPGESDACLQLYWLLRLHPELEPGREPCDWLAEGLLESRLMGPASELYRREIARNPAEAVTPRAGRLLTGRASAGAVVDFCEWRWQAAGKLERPDVVAADIELLRGRSAYDDQASWGRLLLLAIDQLAWVHDRDTREFVDQLRAEVEDLPHLHEELGVSLDRLDLLLELREAWPKLRATNDVPGEWLRLIPETWRRSPAEIRPQLMGLAERIAESPSRGLKNFDRLAALSPAAAAQLGQAFSALAQDLAVFEGTGWRWAQLTDIVQRFLNSNYGDRYTTLREKLLRFCLTEGIDPEDVGTAADEHMQSWTADSQTLADNIRRDGPLRFTFHACRAARG